MDTNYSTLSSDKSSILVLSTTSVNDSENTSISSTLNSKLSSSTSSTKIDCISENALNSIKQTTINDEISLIHTPLSHEKEIGRLEQQINALNLRLNDCKTENKELKEMFDSLDRNKCAKMINNEYVDVQNIILAEKIEQYLTETNRLLKDETQFKLAFNYLINHFWSIIAFQYNDENLDKVKRLRDCLLEKIDSIDKKIQNSNLNLTSLSNESSINVIDFESELDVFKHSANQIKNKIAHQNEIVKNLIHSFAISNTESTTESNSQKSDSTTTSRQQKEADNEHEKEDEEEDGNSVISPSSSPTSFVFDYFANKYKSVKDRNPSLVDQSSASALSSLNTLTEQQVEQTAQQNEQKPVNNDYFYYHVNDYIAIDKTMELHEELWPKKDELVNNDSVLSSANSSFARINDSYTNETRDPAVFIDSKLTPIEPSPATSSSSSTNQKNSNYECPFCKLSADPASISYNLFEEHVSECERSNESLLFCMFCLKSFNKDSDQQIYREHIDSHL
jgi:hypothetical protein